MLNNVTLVGRVVELPVVLKTADGSKYGCVVIDITRPFCNSDGKYSYDRISITLWKGNVDYILDHCHIGDFISVKERLQSHFLESKEHANYTYEIVAEHVSILDDRKEYK